MAWVQLILLAVLGLDCGAAEPPRIAVFSSSRTEAHQQTVDAFTASLIKYHPSAIILRLLPDNKNAEQDEFTDQFRQSPPDLVFCLGIQAMRMAHKQFPGRPMVCTFIMDEQQVAADPNVTSISLRIAPRTQFDWLRRFLPHAKQIGVLYDPQQNGSWVDLAEKSASAVGLELIPIAVNDPTDLPLALKTLARQADVLLGIPDKTVYSRKTAKAVLLSSFRNRIPFVGLSKSWVKAGALYALEPDYKDLGIQSDALAIRALEGTPVSKLPTEPPEKLAYTVNLKTAEHLKTDISSDLLDATSQIYR